MSTLLSKIAVFVASVHRYSVARQRPSCDSHTDDYVPLFAHTFEHLVLNANHSTLCAVAIPHRSITLPQKQVPLKL